VRAVEGFGASGEGAYARCRAILDEAGSMRARAEHSADLVRFLNAWACRLDSKKAPGAFRDWILAHVSELEALEGVALTDPRVPGLAAEVDALYDSLIALRPQLRNIGDAAASKALHQLLPRLVVMWDKAIRTEALAAGHETYGAFLAAMHELSTRLLAEAGLTAAEAEARLGAATTLAKRVDEANIFWAAQRSR
jgi:hypothetical protein